MVAATLALHEWAQVPCRLEDNILFQKTLRMLLDKNQILSPADDCLLKKSVEPQPMDLHERIRALEFEGAISE